MVGMALDASNVGARARFVSGQILDSGLYLLTLAGSGPAGLLTPGPGCVWKGGRLCACALQSAGVFLFATEVGFLNRGVILQQIRGGRSYSTINSCSVVPATASKETARRTT